MRILLDTHVLIWALGEPQKLSAAVRDAITDPQNDVLFSAGSIWEIAIKFRLRRIDLSVEPNRIAREAMSNGFEELPIGATAAARVADLALHHGDPFDRILIAQALCEPAKFFTADAALSPYSDLVTLI
ncbi:MAG: type II toxin-antitoxin system VapC family toxin [Candidatus Eremiobacteraeota bacterium]|nr:type II toxin-antitoxin system VapC family toxin [Candidatus Eremiobacteraeota bacterium]